jgi:hypothetical protein
MLFLGRFSSPFGNNIRTNMRNRTVSPPQKQIHTTRRILVSLAHVSCFRLLQKLDAAFDFHAYCATTNTVIDYPDLL